MKREYLLPIQIKAEHLDDAWWKALRKCFQFGYEYKVEHGSYVGQNRYEFDYVTIIIKDPAKQICPIMPEGLSIPPPASKEQIEIYFADYIMADAKSEKEDYRYGERLVAPKLRLVVRTDLQKKHEESFFVFEGRDGNGVLHKSRITHPIEMQVNQIEEVVRKYTEGGIGNNQCTMEIAMPNDILLADPPCCRLIDTRIRYGKLHFIIYFRSWDLYSAFPVNLGGMELLKQFMVDALQDQGVEVENGSMIVMSKGLHVYSQYYGLVESQLKMTIQQLREQVKGG